MRHFYMNHSILYTCDRRWTSDCVTLCVGRKNGGKIRESEKERESHTPIQNFTRNQIRDEIPFLDLENIRKKHSAIKKQTQSTSENRARQTIRKKKLIINSIKIRGSINKRRLFHLHSILLNDLHWIAQDTPFQTTVVFTQTFKQSNAIAHSTTI